MPWITWLIIGGAIAALLLLKRISLVAPNMARACLNQGAKVIDVRTEAEYQEGHVSGALNIPLDRLREEIPRQAPDKHQPLLLHCLSGGRSALGKRMLKHLGYTNVFNLGSYRRAQRIVADANEPPG
jgi:phage shock protein E